MSIKKKDTEMIDIAANFLEFYNFTYARKHWMTINLKRLTCYPQLMIFLNSCFFENSVPNLTK